MGKVNRPHWTSILDRTLNNLRTCILLGVITCMLIVLSTIFDGGNMMDYPAYKIETPMIRHPTKGFIDIDLSSIPDPKLSSVRRMHLKRIYTVGEYFNVNVILRDKYGRRLQNGGDVLRIWLVNYNLGANVIGSTTYIGNGTYVGEILLPWRGNATLIVSIGQTRQAITSVMDVMNIYGNVYEMYGLFSTEVDRYHGQTDKTLCSTVSNPRMGANVCNLTSQNFGYSWFCAKPKLLHCEDWKGVSGRMQSFLPEHIAIKTRKQHMRIKNTVDIQIDGETDIRARRNVVTCHDRPKASTWTEAVPTGFYYKKKWNFVNCRGQVKRTERSYIQCLRGRHLLIIGDSTTRQIVHSLTATLDLFFPGKQPIGPYLHFVFGHNRANNVSVSWFPHEHPFFNAQYLPITLMQSVANRLNNIDSHNNSIILIHIWAHLIRIPPVVFRQHIRGISNSVRNLLRRSPEVSIYIKGPHAILDRECIEPVDYLDTIHKHIWFEEFQDLHDNVTYINMWDMTAGMENVHIHPEDNLVDDIIHKFMSYACPS